METKQKKKKPGRRKKSAAERHEWAAICNRIHEAAGGMTQAKVAEELRVDTRVWGSYLKGKRSPKTLEAGARIIEAAVERGWRGSVFTSPPQMGEALNWTPADLLEFKKMGEEDAAAADLARTALKALQRLNTYNFSRVAVPSSLFSQVQRQVELIRARLEELPPEIVVGTMREC